MTSHFMYVFFTLIGLGKWGSQGVGIKEGMTTLTIPKNLWVGCKNIIGFSAFILLILNI